MIAASESVDSLTTPLLRSPDSISNPRTSVLESKGNKRCRLFCILFAVILERLAYYSLLGNLVVYLTTVLKWESDETLTTTLIFTGFTWISCFIGGISGDALYGRMNTITLGLLAYFIGFLFLPFISFVVSPKIPPNETGTQPLIVAWLIVSLLLISLGEGCFKSNMSPFGADQHNLQDGQEMEKFFSFYYWAINIGSFLGYCPVVYIQDNVGFKAGHGTAAGCLLLALSLFMVIRKIGYVLNPPAPNVLTKISRIIKEARKNRKKKPLASPSEYTGSGCYEDYVPIKHWLDRAMGKYGGSYLEAEVEEVKVLFGMLPVFGFLIVYCILYYQTNSTFVLQGMHMNVALPNFSVPVAWLALTNIIFVIVFVPVIRKGLFPCLQKLNIHLSYFAKIMIGMFIASLAVASAGIVEYFRISCEETVNNTISISIIEGKKFSIFYQIPQFGLMGISEIFVMITGLEFAYCQAPKKMQAIVTGLFFIANGIGSMLGSLAFFIAKTIFHIQVPIIKNKSHKDLSHIGPLKGRLDYFFFSLAVLNLLNLLLFARYSWKKGTDKRKRQNASVDEYIKSHLQRKPR